MAQYGATTLNSGMTALEYNGVQFGGADSEYQLYWPRIVMEGKTMYDGGGICSPGMMIGISLNTVLVPTENGESGNTFQRYAITNRLMTPNKTLKIGTGTGLEELFFGGTTSNITKSISMFGVKPQVCNIRSIGDGTLGSWVLEWKFTATVAWCDNQSFGGDLFQDGIHAFSYQTEWIVSRNGLQTRVVSGDFFHHFNNQNQTYALPNSGTLSLRTVDVLREKIDIPVPLGFRRERQSWMESADKSHERFEVVDQQLPGTGYPKGIIAADGSQTLTTLSEGGEGGPWATFAKANFVLNVNFEVSPAYDPYWGIVAFLQAVLEAYDKLKVQYQIAGEDKVTTVLPTKISLRRGLYDSSRMIAGEVVFHIINSSVNLISNQQVMAHHAPHIDNWLEQLESWKEVTRARGTSQLRNLSLPNDGTMCGEYMPGDGLTRCPTVGSAVSWHTDNAAPHPHDVFMLLCDGESKWIGYQVSAVLEDYEGVQQVLRDGAGPLELYTQPVTPPAGIGGSMPRMKPVNSPAVIPPELQPVNFKDHTGQTAIEVSFRGEWVGDTSAMTLPTLISANGVPLNPGNRRVKIEQSGNIAGCPKYKVEFKQMYTQSATADKPFIKFIWDPYGGTHSNSGATDGKL